MPKLPHFFQIICIVIVILLIPDIIISVNITYIIISIIIIDIAISVIVPMGNSLFDCTVFHTFSTVLWLG